MYPHATTLPLDRCPRCGISKPLLSYQHQLEFKNPKQRFWNLYSCSNCAGLIIGELVGDRVKNIQPNVRNVATEIPGKARELLRQARNSLAQPAGSIMLSASTVDAMLKAKGLKKGTLYSRIEMAAKQGVITVDMKTWAHQVRLDANDQRHADDDASLPTEEDARLVLDFAEALGHLLFVLPARVTRGIRDSAPKTS
jgi:Domain of unknown function (DUF4145)